MNSTFPRIEPLNTTGISATKWDEAPSINGAVNPNHAEVSRWWPGRSPQTIPVMSCFGLESNEIINPIFSFMIPVAANTTTENHTCADVYDTYC